MSLPRPAMIRTFPPFSAAPIGTGVFITATAKDPAIRARVRSWGLATMFHSISRPSVLKNPFSLAAYRGQLMAVNEGSANFSLKGLSVGGGLPTPGIAASKTDNRSKKQEIRTTD